MGHAEMDRFARRAPRPVSLAQILATTDPWDAAKFLYAEYPVRCAERVRMIESIPRWWDVPELDETHRRHVMAFSRMRAVRLSTGRKGRSRSLDELTSVVRKIVTYNADMVELIARGAASLYRDRGDEVDSDFIDDFLSRYLLNRLGTNCLIRQYLALADGSEGIVDPNCDVARVCREAAVAVRRVCKLNTGRCPPINVEAYSADGQDGAGPPQFAFIPAALSYILQELLKNSCRATVDVANGDIDEIWRRPVTIVVCADERRMVISIADRAGGIPFDVTRNVWSYLYTTTRKARRHIGDSAGEEEDGEEATELAGYGVGLPMARLYARYLGGNLSVVSLPGYGTNAYVELPRISTEQVEIVPNNGDDHEWCTRVWRNELVF